MSAPADMPLTPALAGAGQRERLDPEGSAAARREETGGQGSSAGRGEGAPPGAPSPGRWRGALAPAEALIRSRQGSVVLLIALIFVLFGIGAATISGFGSRSNIDSIVVLASFLGIAAAGQTLVIVLGGIDLSVASGIGLGEVVTSVEYSRGTPLWEILLVLLGFGIVIGLANGWISSHFRVHPLIVTLGIGFVISGGALIWTTGGSAQGESPHLFKQMTSLGSTIGPIPVPPVLIVWVVVAIVVLAIQRRARLGGEIYALGSSPEAARLALARRRTTWVFAYIISAIASIITGVLLSGFSGGADFSAGAPYLFNSIAAVVVGGTSLLGGSGGYGRTIVGTLIMIEITSILVGYGVGGALQEALLGAFIVLVAALAGREAHIRTRI